MAILTVLKPTTCNEEINGKYDINELYIKIESIFTPFLNKLMIEAITNYNYNYSTLLGALILSNEKSFEYVIKSHNTTSFNYGIHLLDMPKNNIRASLMYVLSKICEELNNLISMEPYIKLYIIKLLLDDDIIKFDDKQYYLDPNYKMFTYGKIIISSIKYTYGILLNLQLSYENTNNYTNIPNLDYPNVIMYPVNEIQYESLANYGIDLNECYNPSSKCKKFLINYNNTSLMYIYYPIIIFNLLRKFFEQPTKSSIIFDKISKFSDNTNYLYGNKNHDNINLENIREQHNYVKKIVKNFNNDFGKYFEYFDNLTFIPYDCTDYENFISKINIIKFNSSSEITYETIINNFMEVFYSTYDNDISVIIENSNVPNYLFIDDKIYDKPFDENISILRKRRILNEYKKKKIGKIILDIYDKYDPDLVIKSYTYKFDNGINIFLTYEALRIGEGFDYLRFPIENPYLNTELRNKSKNTIILHNKQQLADYVLIFQETFQIINRIQRNELFPYLIPIFPLYSLRDVNLLKSQININKSRAISYKSINVGDIITTINFLSTSYSHSYNYRPFLKKDAVLYIIYVKNTSDNICFIDNYTYCKTEYEVLIKNNSILKCIGKKYSCLLNNDNYQNIEVFGFVLENSLNQFTEQEISDLKLYFKIQHEYENIKKFMDNLFNSRNESNMNLNKKTIQYLDNQFINHNLHDFTKIHAPLEKITQNKKTQNNNPYKFELKNKTTLDIEEQTNNFIPNDIINQLIFLTNQTNNLKIFEQVINKLNSINKNVKSNELTLKLFELTNIDNFQSQIFIPKQENSILTFISDITKLDTNTDDDYHNKLFKIYDLIYFIDNTIYWIISNYNSFKDINKLYESIQTISNSLDVLEVKSLDFYQIDTYIDKIKKILSIITTDIQYKNKIEEYFNIYTYEPNRFDMVENFDDNYDIKDEYKN